MNRAAVYVLVAVLALVAGGLAAWWHLRASAGDLRADAAFWNTTLPDADGRSHPLSAWRGKTLVVNFWATWCPPCRAEIPDFVALRAQYRGRDVEFIGLAIDDAQRVAAFAREMAVPYPLLVADATGHALAERLGNPSGALPYTVVIDRSGRVVLRHLGRLPREALAAALAKALAQ
jgi:thiol-disulfide isomerase/thioredoxin